MGGASVGCILVAAAVAALLPVAAAQTNNWNSIMIEGPKGSSILAVVRGSCTRTKNKNLVRVNSEIFGSHNLDRFVEKVRGSST